MQHKCKSNLKFLQNIFNSRKHVLKRAPYMQFCSLFPMWLDCWSNNVSVWQLIGLSVMAESTAASPMHTGSLFLNVYMRRGSPGQLKQFQILYGASEIVRKIFMGSRVRLFTLTQLSDYRLIFHRMHGISSSHFIFSASLYIIDTSKCLLHAS